MRSSGEAWGACNKKHSMSVSVEKSGDKGLGFPEAAVRRWQISCAQNGGGVGRVAAEKKAKKLISVR